MANENTKIFFKDNWKNILLVVFFFVIIILLMSTTCTSQRLDVAQNNIKALNDTLQTYTLKNGELMYEKQGFIADKKELEKYIDIKEKEIKDIEKQLKSAVATIAKLQGQVRIDTIHTKDSIEVLPDSTYKCHFNYEDTWLSLNGITNINLDPFNTHTTINNIGMNVPVKIGTTKDNQWFVTSENPYVIFTNIDGVNIEKSKPKRFSVGVECGLGLVGGVGLVGTQFNNITISNTGAGWFVGAGCYIGLGFTYKFIEF